jgi:hypothetical protein
MRKQKYLKRSSRKTLRLPTYAPSYVQARLPAIFIGRQNQANSEMLFALQQLESLHTAQGCQIFLGPNIPIREKYTK